MNLDDFLKRVRASKQFNNFYHFTDKRNLPSIKQDGLLSTSELRRLNKFNNVITGGDANSLLSDAKTGTDKFVCLCFTKNHPMSFRATERGLDPVYLSINPEIIKVQGVMITDAASNQSGVMRVAAADALDNLHLDCIYERIDWTLHPEAHKHRKLAEKYEILVPECVSLNYIQDEL